MMRLHYHKKTQSERTRPWPPSTSPPPEPETPSSFRTDPDARSRGRLAHRQSHRRGRDHRAAWRSRPPAASAPDARRDIPDHQRRLAVHRRGRGARRPMQATMWLFQSARRILSPIYPPVLSSSSTASPQPTTCSTSATWLISPQPMDCPPTSSGGSWPIMQPFRRDAAPLTQAGRSTRRVIARTSSKR